MKKQVDVVIIGAGSAGLAALKQVQKSTDSFVIVNDGPYGTTCARVGCMPSKTLIASANAFHSRNKAAAFGIHGADKLTVDIPAVLERVRNLRDRFVSGVLKATADLGDKSISGRARLVKKNVVEVNGHEFIAKRIIIATGSQPVLPEPWRLLGDRIVTTDNFFELKDLPAKMAVIGLGAIGVEMAQALSRLGIEVHAFGKNDTIAGVTDPVVAKTVRNTLAQEFSIYTGHEVELAETANGVRVLAGPTDLKVDKVLVAIGRKPNLDDLGLNKLGVKLNNKGIPEFDRNTMQLGDLPLFIAGDVNADLSLLHEAADEGYIAGVNAVSDSLTCFKRRTPLAIVFSEPGIAAVGQRFNQLATSCLVGCVDFGTQGRALTAQTNQGVLRVYANSGDYRILGAEMCAPAAEHLAHLLALAIQRQLTVHDMLAMPFYHPVLEEGLRTALRDISVQSAVSQADLSHCSAFGSAALD
ncbi:dihydrolipoyl dehydrogenase [Vibrio metschnikovii]|uniref:Dihydrolipoyl dehydrogenase n=2 Tax=Unclassified Bacteria TaxID=49928 RepID=A0AAU6UQ77_UNCXX|nr:dihydrolipoyl dehydrogenase [Vibrio metschnikovii]EKO3610443.1 dihydrolipoyl dehydrogenase [Vibrio metschnikovii]EKO3641032.1 dihydrolipoyl dehydrogenase [Vibrio metschnikovii]EKO3680030.1 dihydrolipoyl dehydrogenase [Vibrio metschnikovii]EKO3704114.1 dihydrolipoyl dehydrogenase [Vibrio metschnikovii]